MANVTSKSENVEDVTLTYTDLKSHVEALQAEQEQLMKLMEQAKTVEDTMSIQSRLTDVRYELESYMSQLKVYDNQVDYDTVNISIQEVKNETPTGELSIGQKMLNGLENSLRAIAESAKNLCIWFVASIPYFVILFAVIFALDLIHANRERWNNFFMAFLLAMFSYGFQTLFYILSLKSYASASINDMGYCLSAIGWLIMAIIGPHFLEKYLYKSGVSKAAGSGLRMLAQTAMIKA